MQVSFHPHVQNDLNTILAYYESHSGPELADEFFDELNTKVVTVLRNPKAFPC